jgi:hypothetical protein
VGREGRSEEGWREREGETGVKVESHQNISFSFPTSFP